MFILLNIRYYVKGKRLSWSTNPTTSTSTTFNQVKITLSRLPDGIFIRCKCFTPNKNGTPAGLNISKNKCDKQPIKKPMSGVKCWQQRNSPTR